MVVGAERTKKRVEMGGKVYRGRSGENLELKSGKKGRSSERKKGGGN